MYESKVPDWESGIFAALAPLPDGGVKRALVRFAGLLVDRAN